MGKDALKNKPRVGQISYTNCIPFYHQLQDFEFLKSVPAEVNQAMHEGAVDIAPVSSLEYLNHAEDYYVLPQFAIAAREFSGSVILFSHKKIESLNGVKIALTRESLSSSALLKILLKFKYQFENDFVVEESNPEGMLEKYSAALVIGDDALFYHPKEFVYKYDLAELWWRWTGKPFCFAVWAVRRTFADAHPEAVELFAQELKSNLENNLSNLEALIKNSMRLTFLDARFSKVFGYLFNLNYVLDAETQQGLQLFYRLANRLQSAPKPEKISFFELVRG